MGSRRPTRSSPLETVQQMLDRRATIRWGCDVGGHGGDVDLARVVAAGKGDAVLALRRPPCTVPGCPGRVRFFDQTGAWPKLLDAFTDRDAEWWDYGELRRRELRGA